tara:strand:- start:417 stop:557 length:141 start_codon:yes stop_codon:yes gene_type:complete
MNKQDIKELHERINRIKVKVLMEEPCPIYEADEKDWEDFWYGPESH